MKKSLLLLFLLIYPIISFANTIISAEYFIDADPGQGNGTSLTGTFGSSTATASLSGISTSGLSLGTHIVYVRFQGSDSSWGEPSAVFLNVGNPNSGAIISAEYYIGGDPGEGNGISLTGSFGGSEVTASLSGISTTGLSFGTHIVYVRFQGSDTNWGNSSAVFFNVGNPNSGTIVSAEYFIDADPGEGNGIPLSGTFGGSIATATINNISTTGLSYGTHNVYARFKDSNDNWGDVRSKTIFSSLGQQALEYDGVDDYVSLNSDISLDSDNWSISWWMNREENNYECIFSKELNEYCGQIEIDKNSDEIRVESFTNNTWTGNFNTNINTADGSWHHYSLSFSSNDSKLYIDGYLQDTQSDNTDTHDFIIRYIGMQQNQESPYIYGEHFNGTIDEVQIWNHALTQQEIQEKMYRELNMSNPADTTDLVGYWDFNEGLGDIAFDKTQYSNNGSLVNNPQWVDGYNFQLFEIDPPSGNYVDDIWVKINCDIPDARIMYTTDGSEPAENHGETYVDSFLVIASNINDPDTVRAVALIERQLRNGSPYYFQTANSTATYIMDYSNEPIFDFRIINNPIDPVPLTHIRFRLSDDSYKYCDIQFDDDPPYVRVTRDKFEINSPSIERIDLIDNEVLIGHIGFNYSSADFTNNKQIDATLFVHDEPDKSGYPGWKYYEDDDQRMLSMLIPPKNSFSEINTSLPATLFVHGIGGMYPYWGETFVGDLEDNFDTWQFYYPYDQQIEMSANLLESALNVILENEYIPDIGRVNVIAHSMGGLVTRSYIQSGYYSNDINKFIMLGTPNHGSYSSYCINMHGNVESLSNKYITHIDEYSPGNLQMIPNSSFLYELNSQEPLQLFEGSINNRTYLVVAGTQNKIKKLHQEITLSLFTHYDDMVVSVPSANLLEYEIPLMTVRYDHVNLHGENTELKNIVISEAMTATFMESFLSDDYDPNDVNNSSYQNIVNFSESFFVSNHNNGLNIVERKNEADFPNPLTSIFTLSFDRYIVMEDFYSYEVGNCLIYDFLPESEIIASYPSPNYGTFHCSDPGKVIHKNYFLEGMQYPFPYQTSLGLGNPFTDQTLTMKLAKGIGQYISGTVTPGAYFNPLITNNITLSIPREIASAINFDNSTNSFSSRITSNFDREVIEEEYYVDAAMDSMIFYMGGFEGNPDFADHNMTLITPDELVVDSTYAINDPDMEYLEDIENGFAFYFVVDPQPGIWKLQYNNALPDSNTIVYLDSPIIINIEFPDTNYVQNDSIFFEISLPQPIEYTNVQISAELFYNTQSDSLQSLGNIQLYLSADSLSYRGNFLAENFGLYEITVDFSCTLNSEQIERHTYNSVLVSNVSAPVLISPGNGSVHQPSEVTLSWHSAKNATLYNIQVFAGSDTLTFEEVSVSDTTFFLDSLSFNTEYYWQVNSENGNGSSNWSYANFFSTEIAPPELVFPENTNNNVSSNSQLIWNTVDNAIEYQVQLAFNDLFNEPIINDSTVTDSTYSLNSLINTYSYFWRVRGISVYGNSDWSETRSFTVREFDIDFPETLEFPEDSTAVIYLPDYIADFDLGRTVVEISGISNIHTSQDIYSLTISADENWNGEESLVITVFDGINATRATAVDTMSTTVSPVNDPPTIQLPDSLYFYYGDNLEIDFSQYINDIDNELYELSLTVEENSNINIQIVDHLVTLSGINNWVGEDTLTFFIDDGINPVRKSKRDNKRQAIDSNAKDSRINNQDKSMSIPNSTRALTSDQILVMVKLAIPENLSIENNDGVCLITWDIVPAANGYIVYSSIDPNALFSEWILETQSPIADTYWIDTENVDKKFFRIVAVKEENTERSPRKNILKSSSTIKRVNRNIPISNENQNTLKEEFIITPSSTKKSKE